VKKTTPIALMEGFDAPRESLRRRPLSGVSGVSGISGVSGFSSESLGSEATHIPKTPRSPSPLPRPVSEILVRDLYT